MHNKHAWIVRNGRGIKTGSSRHQTGRLLAFPSKTADEERWNYYDEPLIGDLEEFRGSLRKYQRRRAAYGMFFGGS